jgi:predicted metal-dependent enzyme (double-stranded beta helix superfamily)
MRSDFTDWEKTQMRITGLIVGLFTVTTGSAQQEYPNIEGETLLEDDRVVVQRFVLESGEWEGIHEHPENQLVIVLNSTNELVYRDRG